MNKLFAAIACCLLLATTVPMGSADETPMPNVTAIHQELMATLGNPVPGPTPTHPGIGNDLGCDSTGPSWGYGAAGTPTGPCTNFAYSTLQITHSIVNCSAYCYTFAYGYDQTTWQDGYYEVFCPTGAHGIIDWSTTPATATWLSGSCNLYEWNNPSNFPLYTYGYGQAGIKFSWADNLVDALLHL